MRPGRPTITLRGITLHAGGPSGVPTQWYRDGALLAGETKAVLVPRATGNYTVALKGTCATVVSEAFPVSEVPALGAGVVYPNPATVQVALELPAGVTCSRASLLDGTGREVARPLVSGNGSVTFDTSLLRKGIYLLRAHTSAGMVQRKVLVHQ